MEKARFFTDINGQSLLEALIALGIFAITLGAAMAVFFGSDAFITNGRIAQAGLQRARDAFEGVRTIRDRSWEELADGDHGLVFTGSQWQFIGTSDTQNDITRVVTVSAVDDATKKMFVRVTWSTNPTRTQKIDFSYELTRWQTPLQDDKIWGDWSKPVLVGTGDIGPGNQGTDLAYQNNYIYMTGAAKSVAKPDLFIFDVTDVTNPILKSSFDLEEGLQAIAVQGIYAYVVEGASSDFFIINISDPSAPQKVSKLTLGGGNGLSVFVKGMFAYIGQTKSGGKEFLIVNVSNPNSPQLVGSLEIGANVAGISLLGSTAYAAVAKSNEELMLINVQNPLAPSKISGFDATGNSELGSSVYAKTANRIYLGRQIGGNHTNHHEFYIVDGTNQQSPAAVGSVDVPSALNDLATVATVSFLATDDPNKEFQTVSVTSPTAPKLLGLKNLSQEATGLVFNNNYVFLSIRSNDALQILTSTQ